MYPAPSHLSLNRPNKQKQSLQLGNTYENTELAPACYIGSYESNTAGITGVLTRES